MRRSSSFVLAVAALLLGSPAFAQFSPGPNPITGTVGAQSLTTGTGTVDAGGTITASGSSASLALTGTSTLVNNGNILATGTGRAIDSNSGVATLNVTNTGLIGSQSTDAFRVNTNSAVSLVNSGTIRVINGGQAIDWAAITSKSNMLTNLAGGLISAVAEDAIRPGTGGVVKNAGTISATPVLDDGDVSGSDGIDLRTFTGIEVTNSGTITGRHGIATDGANEGPSTIKVNNNTGGLISAINGSGLNIDGAAVDVTATVFNQLGATFRGGVLAGASEADGDGIDVDGVLTLENAGDILGYGARGADNDAEGIAAGGGSIVNHASGRIIGSSLLADAPNGDSGKAGNGILIDNSSGGPAVAATTITNSGLIQGKTGFAIKMIGTFANTVTNNAGGTIQGAGSDAAIQTGDGNDALITRGSIISDTGNAIDLQGGNDQLKIEGGAASITGNVSGGSGTNTVTINPGAGNSFSYAGSFSNFDALEVQSGRVTLSGVNAYTGNTVLSGGTLVLDGVDRIWTTSALVLGGGTLELDALTANGQTFADLALTEDSAIDLGLSSLSFNAFGGAIGLGKTLAILDWTDTNSPTYAFRFLGDISTDAGFLALIAGTTINGLAVTFDFDGTYTNVRPVPLPAALPLLISGLGLFGVMRRRRKAGAVDAAA